MTLAAGPTVIGVQFKLASWHFALFCSKSEPENLSL